MKKLIGILKNRGFKVVDLGEHGCAIPYHENTTLVHFSIVKKENQFELVDHHISSTLKMYGDASDITNYIIFND